MLITGQLLLVLSMMVKGKKGVCNACYIIQIHCLGDWFSIVDWQIKTGDLELHSWMWSKHPRP